MLIPYESDEQAAIFGWWAYRHTYFGVDEKLLFAIPNGGFRNKITAKNLKKQGVKAGIPDIFLAVPRHDYHGLFLEMKRKKNAYVSKNQKEMINILMDQGYLVRVVKGFEAAAISITQYLIKENDKVDILPKEWIKIKTTRSNDGKIFTFESIKKETYGCSS